MRDKASLVQASEYEMASVVEHEGFVAVSFPPDLAVAAVERFLSYTLLKGVAFYAENHKEQALYPLKPEEWCVGIQVLGRDPILRVFPQSAVTAPTVFVMDETITQCLVFPRDTIHILPAHVKRAKKALERVREETYQDESGAPLSWSRVDTPTTTLHGHEDDTKDTRQCIEGPEVLDTLPPESDDDSSLLPRKDIMQEFERIRQSLKLPEFPLSLYRGTINKNGFVTGRVFSHKDRPLRMVVTICPNADLAETAATLVHEFAHLTSNASGHGEAFKEALVKVASDVYGARFFTAPRQRLHESYPILDMWIATGIRAALKKAAPPVARDFDEQLTASVVSRIQKMRALAADQPGTAEAITATAIANTQVTLFELGDYRIRLDAAIDEQMVDRWLNIGKGVRWKRNLAYLVAEFCNVFSLARPDKGWMHFFGKYRDIIAAEYLYHVCVEHIERRCARHIQVWKARYQGRLTGGKTRSEKISFSTSAVEGISDKMDAIRAHEQESALAHPDAAEAHAFHLTSNDLKEAEDFANIEHEKRGLGWSSDSSNSYLHNESGYEAGQSVQLNTGVSSGKVKGLLT